MVLSISMSVVELARGAKRRVARTMRRGHPCHGHVLTTRRGCEGVTTVYIDCRDATVRGRVAALVARRVRVGGHAGLSTRVEVGLTSDRVRGSHGSIARVRRGDDGDFLRVGGHHAHAHTLRVISTTERSRGSWLKRGMLHWRTLMRRCSQLRGSAEHLRRRRVAPHEWPAKRHKRVTSIHESCQT